MKSAQLLLVLLSSALLLHSSHGNPPISDVELRQLDQDQVEVMQNNLFGNGRQARALQNGDIDVGATNDEGSGDEPAADPVVSEQSASSSTVTRRRRTVEDSDSPKATKSSDSSSSSSEEETATADQNAEEGSGQGPAEDAQPVLKPVDPASGASVKQKRETAAEQPMTAEGSGEEAI